jgi:carbon monoxide dehydrogenase subunit G
MDFRGSVIMDLSGEHVIPADRKTVWQLLNDPEILRQCIPGCEEVEAEGEDRFAARVVLKLGPVKAKFAGSVALEDRVYPESYRIVGEGKGGIAGFAKGAASVQLHEDGKATRLVYSVDAQVGGKIAQLGSRLIKSTSAKLADQFFTRFCEIAAANAAQ